MLEGLFTVDSLIAFATLTVMEVVLGIDNVVFIAILAGKLPAEQQAKARRIGLSLALVMRIALLCAISWIMALTSELFRVLGKGFSGRDLILLVGGLFLVAKATHEIYDKTERRHEDKLVPGRASLGLIIVQIILLDAVFSLDSVITAVGMAQKLPIMIAAVVASIVVMLAFAGTIAAFIQRHPSMKILALAFLLLIGVVLVAEGMGQHIGKGYIYAAMAFSVFVELINMRYRAAQHKPVALHHPFEQPPRSGTAAEGNV